MGWDGLEWLGWDGMDGLRQDSMGWDGMGWDRMRWHGVVCNGVAWDGTTHFPVRFVSVGEQRCALRVPSVSSDPRLCARCQHCPGPTALHPTPQQCRTSWGGSSNSCAGSRAGGQLRWGREWRRSLFQEMGTGEHWANCGRNRSCSPALLMPPRCSGKKGPNPSLPLHPILREGGGWGGKGGQPWGRQPP